MGIKESGDSARAEKGPEKDQKGPKSDRFRPLSVHPRPVGENGLEVNHPDSIP